MKITFPHIKLSRSIKVLPSETFFHNWFLAIFGYKRNEKVCAVANFVMSQQKVKTFWLGEKPLVNVHETQETDQLKNLGIMCWTYNQGLFLSNKLDVV